MTASRPNWKGFLKLSLVSCPIGLYPAISPADRISFRQVNRQTGNRLRQQLVDAVTGDPVESHNKTRGYQVGENQFLMVEDEELETARQEARARPFTAPMSPKALPPQEHEDRPAPPLRSSTPAAQGRPEESRPATAPANPVPPPVKVENTHTIEIERFVPRDQIDPRYFDSAYYIAPREEVAQEAYAVIRDAMLAKEVVGLGRVVMAKRERPIMIAPHGKGLLGVTLHHSHEVRGEAGYFSEIHEIALPDEMLQIAGRIIDMKTADFEPALLEDRYRTVLVSILKDKQAKLSKKSKSVEPKPQNVVHLMDILKLSLSAEKPSAQTSLRKPRRAVAARKSVRTPHPSPRARKAG